MHQFWGLKPWRAGSQDTIDFSQRSELQNNEIDSQGGCCSQQTLSCAVGFVQPLPRRHASERTVEPRTMVSDMFGIAVMFFFFHS